MPTWPACAPDCVAQASTARLLCFMPPLLNTARLMDDNPTLLRLKELETLEKVAEKIDKLTVFGGLGGVLKDVVRIQVPGA